MFKRKQIIKNMQERISILETRHFESRIQEIKFHQKVKQLEQKTKELECKHNFTFDYCNSSIGMFKTNYVQHKCTYCGKITTKQWDCVAKRGQQALKLLNLVPKDWKIKGDKNAKTNTKTENRN